jgi:Dimerisation domain of Ca+-activated chloride-channel, anoctamin
LGSENRDNYFTSVQRSRILYEILSTAVFGKKKKGEVGVERLVEEGVFSAAFPLHDVSSQPSPFYYLAPALLYILYRAHDVCAGMNGARRAPGLICDTFLAAPRNLFATCAAPSAYFMFYF